MPLSSLKNSTIPQINPSRDERLTLCSLAALPEGAFPKRLSQRFKWRRTFTSSPPNKRFLDSAFWTWHIFDLRSINVLKPGLIAIIESIVVRLHDKRIPHLKKKDYDVRRNVFVMNGSLPFYDGLIRGFLARSWYRSC
jgi:hypothetical protein